MNSTWQAVDLHSVRLGSIQALLRVSLGTSRAPRTEEFWNWKHTQSPFGPSLGLAATAGDDLIGLRPLLRWEFRDGEKTWLAGRAVDTATDPRWRRRGIFQELTERLLEQARCEIALIFNTPNATSRPGYLKMGWVPMGPIPLLARVVSPLRLLQNLWSRRAGGQPKIPELIETETVDALLREPDLPRLLAQRPDPRGRLETPTTAEYLRWRYALAPGLAYRAAWDFGPAHGAAVVVRARSRRGLCELDLSEVLVGEGEASVQAAQRLIRQLTAQPGIDHVVAIASQGTPERRALLRARFLPLSWLAPVPVLRVLDPALSQRAIQHWRLTLGDIEVF